MLMALWQPPRYGNAAPGQPSRYGNARRAKVRPSRYGNAALRQPPQYDTPVTLRQPPWYGSVCHGMTTITPGQQPRYGNRRAKVCPPRYGNAAAWQRLPRLGAASPKVRKKRPPLPL